MNTYCANQLAIGMWKIKSSNYLDREMAILATSSISNRQFLYSYLLMASEQKLVEHIDTE